ncbi:MAG: hypothetical protein K6E26_03990 [Clostridiales bacterium]|nr:hypothetical protein [Clostridiales bacterium]
MKAFRKAAAIGMAACMCTVLFAGCLSKKERNAQLEWVEEMSKTFKKDKFEYKGAQNDGEISLDADTAIVKSKKFPKDEILIVNDDGKLMTNYNAVRYQEEVEEYIREYFEELFYCDGVEIQYIPEDDLSPMDNMDFEKYCRKYVHFNRIRVIVYQKNGVFVWDDQTADILTKIAKERDEACSITLYYCTEETDDPVKDAKRYYTLTMNKAREIKSITVAKQGIKKIETLVENETW